MTAAPEMTKAAALHELKLYMHDARAAGRREGYKPDRTETWQMMVECWREDGQISEETARQWIARGPR